MPPAPHSGPAPYQTPIYLPVPVTSDPTPPVRRAQLAILAGHLTPRDQWLLEMVHEHKVLTSHHILALAYTGARTMRARLRLLTVHLRVLDRFRPRIPVGTAPEHYVLGPAGAAWLAAARGISVKEFGYHRARAHQIAISSHLSHTIGTNAFFVALAAAHRADPAAGHLAAWWSERRCLRLWEDLARPDGYGHYTLAPPDTDPAAARHVRFFVEYDTGTEALTRLPAKLPGYARLAAATARPQVVLFHLPSAVREEHLHQQLARDPAPVPVATTHPALLAEHGPAGPVWRPAPTRSGRRAAPRVNLIDLDTLTPPASPRRAAEDLPAGPAWWTEPPTPLPPTDPHTPDRR
ncbi:MAG TPA: replication-relaxation family protein [Actinocrinis sp.]|nr:replication-relaxation family protein [Actinocrinis sp.]